MWKLVTIFLVVSLLFTSGFLIKNTQADLAIPPWIKNIALWYGEGKISESEFVKAIQYLIDNGIIKAKNPEQITLTPDPTFSKEELIEKGIDFLENKNNLAALEFFNEALKKDPEDIRALVDKGIVLARQGKFDDAKKLFDFAIETSEKRGKVDYRAVVNAGITLSIFGNPGDAMTYFDRVINNKDIVRQETLVAAYVNKGVTLLEQGKYEESIIYFDKALEIEPDRLGAIINKANALQELKQYKEALKYFEKAYTIDREPLSWKPRFVIVKAIGSMLVQ